MGSFRSRKRYANIGAGLRTKRIAAGSTVEARQRERRDWGLRTMGHRQERRLSSLISCPFSCRYYAKGDVHIHRETGGGKSISRSLAKAGK
jgi:hypothetical protein